MRKKKKMILIMWISLIPFLLLSGCDSPKESLLEHSGYEFEVFTKKDALTDTEQVPVIEGKILENSSQDNEQQGSQNLIDEKSEVDSSMIYVYICGQVANPGVYQVSSEARVFSVIQLAGGLTEDADATLVNQAETLEDGQMIYIPAVGEEVTAGMTSMLQDGHLQNADSGKVNINTANLEELMGLPGIGEGKAQSILQYRQEHGSFQSIEEIMNVEGIKEGTYSKFKDQITI